MQQQKTTTAGVAAIIYNITLTKIINYYRMKNEIL